MTSGFIIDSLRHLDITSNSNRDIMPAREYIFPTSAKQSLLTINDFEVFYNIIENRFSKIDVAISSSFTGISMAFIQNRLKELNLSNDDFSKSSLKLLFDDIKAFLENINKLTCIEFFNEKNKKDFTVCSNFERQTNLDVNFFIDDFYFNKTQDELFTSYRNSILKFIASYLNKYKARLKSIDKKLCECEDKEKYRIYGELITSNLYKIKDINSSTISLENYYDNNNLLDIPLDKKYSISNNMARYFKKYNKLKNALEICTKQKIDTENELNYIESIVYELENAKDINDINAIYLEISENDIFKSSFKEKKAKQKANSKTSLDPIEVNIDGFTVLIGKNNIGNDYLTTKIANKNDLWFHTKDIHGSHIILRLENNEPNDNVILKCAQIAAFHSKAKLSSMFSTSKHGSPQAISPTSGTSAVSPLYSCGKGCMFPKPVRFNRPSDSNCFTYLCTVASEPKFSACIILRKLGDIPCSLW